jgi:hypothetical protein
MVFKVTKNNVPQAIAFSGPDDMGKTTCTKLISDCDVGLIPRIKDPIYDYAIPAKFYEYTACGLPV